MVLARPLVSFLYGGGEFDAFSIDITAKALAWVSLGMAGYAVQNILSRACFARQDGRTPLIAGLASITVNIILCMLLTQRLQVVGLAIASAVSSTVYALLLLLLMQRGKKRIFPAAFWRDTVAMLLCTVCMAVAACFIRRLLSGFGGKAGELVMLALTAASGAVIYLLAAMLLHLPEAMAIKDKVKHSLKRG